MCAHVFSYALAPHEGDWRSGEVVRQAYLFNMPATGYVRPARDMSVANAPVPRALPSAYSLVATSRPGLVIETIKSAEDGDGVIVRFYDAHNTRGEAALTFARPIASAEETNMLEEAHGPAVYDGHDLRVAVRPYGIGTFRVRLANA